MERGSRKSFFRNIVIFIVCLLIFLNLPYICETHSHSQNADSHHHTHEHEHKHGESPSFKYSREANVKYKEESHYSDNRPASRDKLTLWTQALGSTLLISAAPFLILFLVPLDNSKEREPLLKILLSFASGSLLGDAFLHLIPHAISPHSHDESHSHSHSHSHDSEPHSRDMRVGFWVLFGIIVFLMVEKFVRLVKGGHSHSHSHGEVKHVENDLKKEKIEKTEKDNAEKERKKDKKGSNKEDDKKEVVDSSIREGSDIKVAGYLNLAADFTHNFTDGLAIGASYLAGRNIGIVTTITILLHEVPHEIGDFAILIQSGCSKKKAIFLQLSTAVGALTGTLVSLLAEGIDDTATSWILPFTAGGFIYIATVSVIPELLSDTKFWQSIKEIIALLVGVYMMVLIAYIE